MIMFFRTRISHGNLISTICAAVSLRDGGGMEFNMEEKSYSISVAQLFFMVLKRWWIVVIAVVVGAGSLLAYSKFIAEPMYKTKAMLGVTIVDSMSDYQQTLIGNTIAKESSEILTANITLERAANLLNQKSDRTYTADMLRAMIVTTTSTESRYFTVTVESNSPTEAKLICDTVTQSFCDVLVDENLMKGAEGRIIHHAVVPSSQSSPNVLANTVIGALLGLIVSAAVLIMIGFFNDVIDSEDWLVATFKDEMPVLAVIPDAEAPLGGRKYRNYTRKYGYRYSGYAPKTNDR